jgi:chaperonin GroES
MYDPLQSSELSLQRSVSASSRAASRPSVRVWLERGHSRQPPIHASLESKSMDIRPLHDRIIVQRLEEGEQKIGGIIIPDTAKEKPQQGRVIAAGNGKVNDEGKRIPLDVKAGDLILFGKYTSQEVKLDGEEYLIMREDEVLAVIDGDGTKKK